MKGDNLGQNEVIGIKKNFSKLEHSCRKCLLSRTQLETAHEYDDIHAKFQVKRTDLMLKQNYEESQTLGTL